MSIQVCTVGQRVRLLAEFSTSGTDTDPSTVTLSVKGPSDTVANTVVASRSGTGMYYADIVLTEQGVWSWRFEGTGTCIAVAESFVLAQHSLVI